MPTLEGFSGASLVPDYAGALRAGRTAGREAQVPDLARKSAAGDVNARLLLGQINPKVAESVDAMIASADAAKMAQAQKDIQTHGLLAMQFVQLPADLMQQDDYLKNQAQAAAREGRDIQPFIDIYNVKDPVARQQIAKTKLNELMLSQKLLGEAMGGGNKFQKGEGAIVTGEDGKQYFAIPKFNPETGGIETVMSPVGGTLVGKTGLTPQQTADLEVDTAFKTAMAKINAGTATADDQAYVAKKIEEAKTAGTTGATQAADYVSLGVEAVDNIPTVKDALNLLKTVSTGGKQSSAALWVKSNLGIESADEGELSYLLSKNVLQQLRPTFGAAFTKAEGDSMKEIESGIGRSNATNTRLLQRALSLYERSARRGLLAAKKNKDDFSASEIQRGLDAIQEIRNDSAQKPQKKPESGAKRIKIDANGNVIK